jgi:hypothetical protein
VLSVNQYPAVPLTRGTLGEAQTPRTKELAFSLFFKVSSFSFSAMQHAFFFAETIADANSHLKTDEKKLFSSSLGVVVSAALDAVKNDAQVEKSDRL